MGSYEPKPYSATDILLKENASKQTWVVYGNLPLDTTNVELKCIQCIQLDCSTALFKPNQRENIQLIFYADKSLFERNAHQRTW